MLLLHEPVAENFFGRKRFDAFQSGISQQGELLAPKGEAYKPDYRTFRFGKNRPGRTDQSPSVPTFC